MGYVKRLKNVLIESSESHLLQDGYQAFLNSLNAVDDQIISVNYQTAAYRLDSGNYGAGVSYSVLVTYSSLRWEDGAGVEGEVKNG